MGDMQIPRQSRGKSEILNGQQPTLRNTRGLLVVIALLLSAIIAIVAGVLAFAAGFSIIGAIFSGSAAFAAALTLCLLVFAALALL
ncbi:hypothetical protein [Streptomyces sp. NPDC002553]|uniref:hypothetical protein n=1 Tax=Streptomyces sp. NPDC002553 TaxID=3154417 RepID=UPI00332AEF0E